MVKAPHRKKKGTYGGNAQKGTNIAGRITVKVDSVSFVDDQPTISQKKREGQKTRPDRNPSGGGHGRAFRVLNNIRGKRRRKVVVLL